MQPNQPTSPPPAPPPVTTTPQTSANPYDFLQPAQQKPKKSILPAGNSVLQRLAIVLGIILFLVIGFIVVKNILGSAGKENTTNLVTVVKQQTELIRVADLGASKAKLNITKNLAVTVKASLNSDKPALVKAITDSGTKVDKKSLGSTKDKKTDEQLDKAEQDNRFDEVFTQVMTTKLGEYQKSLKIAYESASGKKLKDSLNVDYQHINLIIGKEQK